MTTKIILGVTLALTLPVTSVHSQSRPLFGADRGIEERAMQPVTIYGIKCSKKDEELLMRRVNGLLATHNRTTSKGTDPSMLKAYEPLKIKYFYWNLNKATGTWFD